MRQLKGCLCEFSSVSSISSTLSGAEHRGMDNPPACTLSKESPFTGQAPSMVTGVYPHDTSDLFMSDRGLSISFIKEEGWQVLNWKCGFSLNFSFIA